MKNYLLILFLLFSQNVFSQNVFERVYLHGLQNPALTLNNSFYLAEDVSDSLGIRHISFSKNDNNGNMIWSQDYFDTNSTWGIQPAVIISLTDGGFVLSAVDDNGGNFLLRGDSMGNILWGKGGLSNVIPTTGNGFISLGGNWPHTNLSLLDSAGNQIYSKEIYPQFHGYGSMKLMPDSNYITLNLFGQIGGSIGINKMDKYGNFFWSTVIVDSLTMSNFTSSGSYKLCPFLNNGFLLYTWIYYQCCTEFSPTIIRFDSSGLLMWAKKISMNSQVEASVIATSDSSIMLVIDSCLIKMDSNGNILWSKKYSIHFRDIVEMSDKGFLLTGSIAYPNPLLIKTDSLGNTVCDGTPVLITDSIPSITQYNTTCSIANYSGTQFPNTSVQDSISTMPFLDNCQVLNFAVINQENNFMVFPNPTTNAFTLKNLPSKDPSATLSILNVLGETVYTKNLFGKNEYTVDANFAKGIYFVRVSDGEKNVVRKLVVE